MPDIFANFDHFSTCLSLHRHISVTKLRNQKVTLRKIHIVLFEGRKLNRLNKFLLEKLFLNKTATIFIRTDFIRKLIPSPKPCFNLNIIIYFLYLHINCSQSVIRPKYCCYLVHNNSCLIQKRKY